MFYLKSDLDVLYYRISEDSTRPLLRTKNPKEVLERLLQKREENYQKAHYVINVSSSDKNEIAEYILGKINETDSDGRN